MSMEEDIANALNSLVANRVYPDVAPTKVQKSYIVYQQVGGVAINYVEGGVVGQSNARVQVAVWSGTRLEASALSRQAEAALRQVASLKTTVLGAPVSVYDEDTKLYGSRQDFSVWFAP